MNTAEWISLGNKVTMNTFSRDDKVLVSGKGSYVEDIDGNQYLDFVSGIACNVLGHADAGFSQALSNQTQELVHISNLYWHQGNIQLAEKLTQLSGLDQVFFANSGAEANEAAIKLARKWGMETKGSDAYEIISLNQSFHGRTMATLSATGQKNLQASFLPLLDGFKYIDFNDSQGLIDSVTDKTCAILIEVIQGEGGVNVLSEDFIQTLNKVQDEANVLLIIDEIQTGIGRAGTMFAYQQTSLKPDIISLAKGLGGGFPIGAIVANKAVANHFSPGDHGTTFGGNPLATAAGMYVLQAIEDRNLLANVREMGQYLVSKITHLENPAIQEIRGQGLLIGLKLTVAVGPVIQAASDQGVLLVAAKDNVLRVLPPLNVSKEEIDKFIDILQKILPTA